MGSLAVGVEGREPPVAGNGGWVTGSTAFPSAGILVSGSSLRSTVPLAFSNASLVSSFFVNTTSAVAVSDMSRLASSSGVEGPSGVAMLSMAEGGESGAAFLVRFLVGRGGGGAVDVGETGAEAAEGDIGDWGRSWRGGRLRRGGGGGGVGKVLVSLTSEGLDSMVFCIVSLFPLGGGEEATSTPNAPRPFSQKVPTLPIPPLFFFCAGCNGGINVSVGWEMFGWDDERKGSLLVIIERLLAVSSSALLSAGAITTAAPPSSSQTRSTTPFRRNLHNSQVTRNRERHHPEWHKG